MNSADGFYNKLLIGPERLVLTADRTLSPYAFIWLESYSKVIFNHLDLSINSARLGAGANSACDDGGAVIVDDCRIVVLAGGGWEDLGL